MWFALIAIMQSCSVVQDPENWKKEIEDAYKIQISQAMAYTAAAFMELDENEVDIAISMLAASADAIEKQKNDDLKDWDDIEKYKLALEKLKSEDATCYYLWEQYHQLDGKVKFSDFVKQPKDGKYSVYTTTEQSNDIRVTFKINKAMEWEVALDEKDLQVYLTNLTSAHYEDHLNSAIESAIDEAIYEAVDEALLEVFTDDEW